MLEFHPVTSERWNDFEHLFECKGSPHYCWCMLWRTNENEKALPGKTGKKASMKNRVRNKTPIGLLAYSDHDPVAWCSIAPRNTYKPLGGNELEGEVWSITCFFIKRSFRKKGITSKLIAAAVEYAKTNDARYIEAYPVSTDSPSYRYMGLMPNFEKVGFQYVKKAGSRRNVMTLSLK